MNDFHPNWGDGRRFGHRLKPAADMQNLLKQVGQASSAIQRTLAISRRFESAGLAETLTDAQFVVATVVACAARAAEVATALREMDSRTDRFCIARIEQQ